MHKQADVYAELYALSFARCQIIGMHVPLQEEADSSPEGLASQPPNIELKSAA